MSEILKRGGSRNLFSRNSENTANREFTAPHLKKNQGQKLRREMSAKKQKTNKHKCIDKKEPPPPPPKKKT